MTRICTALPFHLYRLLFTLMLVGVLGGCGDGPSSTAADGGSPAIRSVADEQAFKTILSDAGERLLVVDFYADWCRPCRQLAPILKDLAHKYGDRVGFYKVNTDANRQLASSMGMRGLPFVVFIKNSSVVDARTGLMPKSAYQQIIKKYM